MYDVRNVYEGNFEGAFYSTCDYFNGGTWQTIIQSQRFLKTKDSQFFFANRPVKFKDHLCNC